MKDVGDRLIVSCFLLTKAEFVFRKLYAKHTAYLYRIVLSLSNDKTVSDDIVQETWIRAIENLPQFKWQSSFKTWITGIAINCCREDNRRRKYSTSIYTGPESDINYNEKNDNKIDIQKAFAMLPEGYREILILHDLEGYKHEEIGQLLEINSGTSKSQLHHARKAIKKFLK